jgi:hypothetical protein
MRLHLLAAPDGTPRAAIPASADHEERDVALRLFAIGIHGGKLVVWDKGYAGRDSEQPPASASARQSCAQPATTNPAADQRCPGSVNGSSRSSGPSKIASASNDTTPSLHGPRARIATKLQDLAAGAWLDHYLQRPIRAFAALAA